MENKETHVWYENSLYVDSKEEALSVSIPLREILHLGVEAALKRYDIEDKHLINYADAAVNDFYETYVAIVNRENDSYRKIKTLKADAEKFKNSNKAALLSSLAEYIERSIGNQAVWHGGRAANTLQLVTFTVPTINIAEKDKV